MQINLDNEVEAGNSCDVDDKLREWIAERLLAATSVADIALSLREKGIREDAITAEIQRATDSPYMRTMQRVASRNRRYEWLLGTYSKLAGMSSSRHVVDRRSGLSADAFYEEYYFRNRPVLLTDVVDDWPAFRLWSPEYFREKFGEEIVEMQINRSASQAKYGPYPSRFCNMVPLREYIDLVLKHSPTNEIYLSRWNNRKFRGWMKKLAEDIRQLPYTGPMEEGSIWFGPAGTVTPLHFDKVNILMVQVVGRKRILLAPSCEAVRLLSDTNNTYEYSDFNPDAAADGLSSHAKNPGFIELVQNPGDVLFLPVGWWHAITALDISVTLTFENFIHEN